MTAVVHTKEACAVRTGKFLRTPLGMSKLFCRGSHKTDGVMTEPSPCLVSLLLPLFVFYTTQMLLLQVVLYSWTKQKNFLFSSPALVLPFKNWVECNAHWRISVKRELKLCKDSPHVSQPRQAWKRCPVRDPCTCFSHVQPMHHSYHQTQPPTSQSHTPAACTFAQYKPRTPSKLAFQISCSGSSIYELLSTNPVHQL